MPLNARVVTLDIEDAYEVIQTLSETETVDLGFITVYSGVHPEYGSVHVTIPAAGKAALHLQFASQQAAT